MATKTYRRDVLCPSCGKKIDFYEGPTPEPNPMGAALLFNDSRRQHAQESPECALSDAWVRGWNYGPVTEVT